jgi:hypothetical protein
MEAAEGSADGVGQGQERDGGECPEQDGVLGPAEDRAQALDQREPPERLRYWSR